MSVDQAEQFGDGCRHGEVAQDPDTVVVCRVGLRAERPDRIADRDERLRGLETALELGRGTIAAIGAYAVPGRLP